MIKINDIVSINEQANMFNGSIKSVEKTYFVINVHNNKIYVEDAMNPFIKKSFDISQISKINGMTVKRYKKVGL